MSSDFASVGEYRARIDSQRWRRIAAAGAQRRQISNEVGQGTRSRDEKRTVGLGMPTILVPVDFSPATAAVLSQAVKLASALRAQVTLFSVVQTPTVLSEYAGLIDNIAEIMMASERATQRHLESLVVKLKSASLAVDFAYEIGSPVPLIVKQAAACRANYILMGSHGHTALYDLLVGSTTHGVLMRAACPVVVVPARNACTAARQQTRPARKI